MSILVNKHIKVITQGMTGGTGSTGGTVGTGTFHTEIAHSIDHEGAKA